MARESNYRAFRDFDELYGWFDEHHEREAELWVRIFKKHSGVVSVDWNDCVLAALSVGLD